MPQPRKRFGQHFLHDKGIISKIIQAINPQRTQHLVEIGPGLGALTHALLPLIDHLDAVEIDRDLIPILKESATEIGKLTIHEFDALKFDFHQLPTPLRVVGNLPYNISTPLIFHLLEQLDCIEDMHFMLQREVVDRLSATPGNKIYGRLSVMVQYHCIVEKLFNVAAGAFNPPPEVESAVVRLRPYPEPPHHANDLSALRMLVNAAFSQRRKTLRKSLSNYLKPADWEAISIDSQRRPEELSVAEFVAISNIFVIASK